MSKLDGVLGTCSGSEICNTPIKDLYSQLENSFETSKSKTRMNVFTLRRRESGSKVYSE